MTTVSSTAASSPQNNQPQSHRGRNLFVILLSVIVLFVLVGWQFLSVHTNNTDPTTLVLDPYHAERLYIGFFLPPQVIYSTDTGKSWQILTGGYLP